MFNIFTKSSDVPSVSPEEAKLDFTKNPAGVAIVDVREPYELTEFSIPGSVNIPLNTIEQKADSLKSYPKIYVICRTGGRSCKAVQLLHEKGLTQAVNITGGIIEWRKKIF